MRIITLLVLSRAVLFTGANNSEEESNEERYVGNESDYGTQQVNHETEFEAMVMKPSPGYGSEEAHRHFQQWWQDKEEEREVDGEDSPFTRLSIQNITGSRGIYDGAQEIGEFITDDLFPIDPNDPEEIEKEKQFRNLDLFSQILSINEDSNVTGLYEGDMRLVAQHRNAAGDEDTWPKNKYGPMKGLALIPYKISRKFNKTEVNIMKSAIELYTKHTCIRFVPHKQQIAYIYISDGNGCWATVGRSGFSAQTVSLGRFCVTRGIVAHELMHVIGFQHEHSRSDRDNHVSIVKYNIKKAMLENFDIRRNTKNLVMYDYNSVMHYSYNAFARIRYLPTIKIKPKRKLEPEIGQREKLSPYDIEEVKYLYHCAEGTYQRCGRDFIDSKEDSFSSPGHPNPYPAESHCTWKITVPKGKYVSLTITELDLEDSKLCQRDAILIHDGSNAGARRIKAVCGTNSTPIEVLSTGKNLFVMFASDPKHQGAFTGFKASFKASASKGVLPRPNMPVWQPIKNPPHSFSCDFESGTCGMIQDTFEELDWIRHKGPTPSLGTGPDSDHTSGNGYYMHIESSDPAKSGHSGILRTPWLAQSRAVCVSFSYHMLGLHMGTLQLIAVQKTKPDPTENEVLLWERHFNQGNKWFTESLTFKPKLDAEYVQFYWQAFVVAYQSDFALDDINIKSSACPPKPPSSIAPQRAIVVSPPTRITTTARTTKSTTTTIQSISTSPISAISCDFDSGFCGWTQDKKVDDFDWISKKGGTESNKTGPRGDHTSGDGYFLYIEASSPRMEGDAARLMSPPLTTEPHCLKIWYHMHGKHMGSFVVRQIINDVDSKLVEKSGNKGDHWYYLEVDIVTPSVKSLGGLKRKAKLTSDASMYIAIDGVRGSGFTGDLAIDDIEITSSACAISQPTDSTASSPILRGASCDFDTRNDLCGFSNGDADFDWTQNSGSTRSKSTGPSVDHTKGDSSGFYMYIEASSPNQKKEVAALMSPKLITGHYCVQFFVHMWGSGMGTIKVYTEEYVNGKMEVRRLKWVMSGSQEDLWLNGEFEFESAMNTDYVQVRFEGVIGTTFTSDAAVDDISITSGWCRDSAGNAANVMTTITTVIKSTTPIAITTKTAIKTKVTAPRTRTGPVNMSKNNVTSKSTTTNKTNERTKSTAMTKKSQATTPVITTKRSRPSTPSTTTKTSTTVARSIPATPATTTIKINAITSTTITKLITTTNPIKTTQTSTTKRATKFLRLVTATTTMFKPRTTKETTTTKRQITTKMPNLAPISVLPATKQNTTRKETNAEASKPATTKGQATTKRQTTTKTPKPVTTMKPSITKRQTTRAPTTRLVFTKPERTTGPGTGKSRSLPAKIKLEETTSHLRKHKAEDKPPVKSTEAIQAQEFSCDFEAEKDCGMTQMNGDKFDWIRHTGTTRSSGTGPLTDHTNASKISGFYIHIEGSKPRAYMDNAIIGTPPISAKPTERCVTFWYHMHGTGIGSLRVWSELSKNGIFKKFPLNQNKKLEFKLNGEKGNSWKLAGFTLQRSSSNHAAALRLHFEGVRGESHTSDIAIDDICITSTSCDVRSTCLPSTHNTIPILKKISTTLLPLKPRLQSGKGPISTKTTAKPNNITETNAIAPTAITLTPQSQKDLAIVDGMPIMMYRCAFDMQTKKMAIFAKLRPVPEDVLCGWKQDKQDDFDWSWRKGQTSTTFTGPSGDHTTGKGQYLFIESSAPRVRHDVAALKSAKMYPTTYCVDLYFHMFGRDIGQLIVRAHHEMLDKRKVLNNLRVISGSKGKLWRRLKINYRPRKNSQNVQFRVEGKVGRDYMGDIAIDDVSITPGRCESCSRPNKKTKNQLGHEMKFATGCVHGNLFYVKCCSTTEKKVIYHKLEKCNPNALTPALLKLMCS